MTIRHSQSDFRRLNHDDGVVIDSYIEIDNVYWLLKWLLTIINQDRLN